MDIKYLLFNLYYRKFLPFFLKHQISSLPDQLSLISQLLREKKFTFIILDSCRYDSFKNTIMLKNIGKKFKGYDLQAVRSAGSNTYEWLPIVFSLKEMKEIKIFSCHPAINKMKEPFKAFTASRYIPTKNIVSLDNKCWDEDLLTCPPKKVRRAVVNEGLSDKNLIWFIQPHFPWLFDPQLTRKVLEINDELHVLGESIKQAMIELNIPADKIRGYYNASLHITLIEVFKMLRKLEPLGRIVISSDHGELLGEYNLYNHYKDMHLPELMTVPWFEVEL